MKEHFVQIIVAIQKYLLLELSGWYKITIQLNCSASLLVSFSCFVNIKLVYLY